MSATRRARSRARHLAGVALLAVLGIGLSTLSWLTVLVVGWTYVFAPIIQAVTMPLLLLSGMLLPMEPAPGGRGRADPGTTRFQVSSSVRPTLKSPGSGMFPQVISVLGAVEIVTTSFALSMVEC